MSLSSSGFWGPSPRMVSRTSTPPPVRRARATLEMATVIIAEAALSFLGLGVGASHPTWGSMLNDGRQFLRQAWWLATFPGLAISALVLSVNLLGDGLRDALDPRLRRSL